MHRSTDSTLRYIHPSGRDLAEAERLDGTDPRLAGADAHRVGGSRRRVMRASATRAGAAEAPWSPGLEDRSWDRRREAVGAAMGEAAAVLDRWGYRSQARPGRNQMPVIEGADQAWAGWVGRWHATSPLTPRVRAIIRTIMAEAGRWLAAEHPEISEPGQWTRQTCAAWVAAVDRMTVGDYVQRADALGRRRGPPGSRRRHLRRGRGRRALAALRPRPRLLHLHLLRAVPPPHGLRTATSTPPRTLPGRRSSRPRTTSSACSCPSHSPTTSAPPSTTARPHWTPCSSATLSGATPREVTAPPGATQLPVTVIRNHR
jgi:hypothetical protein